MPPRTYTDLQLACAVAESKNMREVIAKLGLVACGSNYENVRRRMRELGIHDTFARLDRNRSPIRALTPGDIRDAIPGARSRADVLRRLGIEPTVANSKALARRIEKLGIDTSNLLGRAHNRGRRVSPRYALPLDQVLVRGRPCPATSTLKKRLFQEGLKERCCETCGIRTWLDKPISLELHHRNGDRSDNRLANLMLLCPNCHSLTDTYRGRNIGKGSRA